VLLLLAADGTELSVGRRGASQSNSYGSMLTLLLLELLVEQLVDGMLKETKATLGRGGLLGPCPDGAAAAVRLRSAAAFLRHSVMT